MNNEEKITDVTETLTLTEEDAQTEDSKFEPLEEGLYDAVCIGITVKEMQNYDKTGMEDKIQFIFQVVEGEVTHYVRSKPFKKSVHIKSGLWALISSWTKINDLDKLIDKMGNDGKFNLRWFIGKPIRLTIKHKEYKDKMYPDISDYMAPKKNAPSEYVSEAIPEFLVKDVKSKNLIEGITIKVRSPKVSKSDKVEAPETPAPKAEEAGEEIESDSLPF